MSVCYGYCVIKAEMDVPAISKSRHVGQAMVVVIILLYIATFFSFILSWTFMSLEFTHEQNIWTRWLRLCSNDNSILVLVGLGAASIICNILSDLAMVCVTIMQILVITYFHWNSRFGIAGWSGDSTFWLLYSPPFAYSLVLVKSFLHSVAPTFDPHFNLAFKIWDIHLMLSPVVTPPELDRHNILLYAVFTLVTTIWCTIAIVYRILHVGRANSGAGGGLGAYHHVIEVLVESFALYSVCLIIYVACFSTDTWGWDYLDIITPFARVWKYLFFLQFFHSWSTLYDKVLHQPSLLDGLPQVMLVLTTHGMGALCLHSASGTVGIRQAPRIPWSLSTLMMIWKLRWSEQMSLTLHMFRWALRGYTVTM